MFRKSVFILASAISLNSYGGGIDDEYLKSYGGRYSINCSQSNSPSVDVNKSSLVVNTGKKNIAFNDVETRVDYMGETPPKEFEIAIMGGSEKPTEGADFLIMKDKDGLVGTLDTIYPGSVKSIGSLSKSNFRYCGTAGIAATSKSTAKESNTTTSSQKVLQKISIDLNSDKKQDDVSLIQEGATFKVTANIGGKTLDVFKRKYQSEKEYQDYVKTYDKFSIGQLKVGEKYSDADGNDAKMKSNAIYVYTPPEESHIFIYKNGKFEEVPVFNP